MTETITINRRSFPVVSSTAAERAAKKPSKYRNQKAVVGCIIFDSRAEARRYGVLIDREKRGEISNLVRQPFYALAPAVRLLGEKRQKPALTYRADFAYTEGNARVVEDVKSDATAKTAAFRIKLHLMKSVHGIDVRVVK